MRIGSSIINSINRAYGSKPTAKAKQRKSLGDVMTDENISKMREIAYKDVVEGRGDYSNDYKTFLSELRNEVAPDKKKLLAEARSQFDDDILKERNDCPDNLLEVILEKEGKLKESNGSYNAKISPTGYVVMKIYDENGELAVRVCSSGKYHEFQTTPEQQCGKFFSSIYADAYKEFSNKIKGFDSSSSVKQLDTYV